MDQAAFVAFSILGSNQIGKFKNNQLKSEKVLIQILSQRFELYYSLSSYYLISKFKIFLLFKYLFPPKEFFLLQNNHLNAFHV